MVPETAPTRGYPRPTNYVINVARPDGRMATYGVGRLVCEAFHGPAPDAEHWARHIDRNPYNNEESNLVWQHKRVGMAKGANNRPRQVVRIPND